MKLILAHNQTPQFVEFYDHLQTLSSVPFDYASYNDLLFSFGTDVDHSLQVLNLKHGRTLDEYEGVYINGYMDAYETAATVAICCDDLAVPFVNKELQNPPSLSKLTGYAKLAHAGVPIPATLAGSRAALLRAGTLCPPDIFPAVLKRADADRGVDNFKVDNFSMVQELLSTYEDSSVWILQTYVENNGFYKVSFYAQQPSFVIFRDLQPRPDKNPIKAHMYKPSGGSNASLIALEDAPKNILDACQQAVIALDRQIAGVDCILELGTSNAFVLEVNYNPQLVTIETFKEVRVKAFLDNLEKDWR